MIDKKVKLAVKNVIDSIQRLISDYGQGKLAHSTFVAMMKADIASLEMITKGL